MCHHAPSVLCVLLTHVCMPSFRWALSQQGASEQLKSLWFGWLLSKKSWVMIGSVPACFAWEPAAYWLTLRGRWVRSKHAVDMTCLILHVVLTDVFAWTDLSSGDWTVCSVSWPSHGLNFKEELRRSTRASIVNLLLVQGAFSVLMNNPAGNLKLEVKNMMKFFTCYNLTIALHKINTEWKQFVSCLFL